MTDDKNNLLALIRLIKIDLKDLTDNVEHNDNDTSTFNFNFDKRLKTQKIVYLIEKTTGDFNYNFSLYLRGPYSSALAGDYYSLASENNIPSKEGNLKKETREIAKKLNEKDNIWLEIASTIRMMISDDDEADAIKRTIELKTDILKANNKDENYINEVVLEMKTLNLLKNTVNM